MSWKAKIRRVINEVLEPAGFTLRRFRPEMQFCVMETPAVRRRQIAMFRRMISDTLVRTPMILQGLPSEAEIEAFAAVLPSCPIRQDTGGGGFSAAMLLWTIVSALKPVTIVESGVYRGFTTWVLRQACQHARQYAFDITFAERRRVEPGVIYHESNWMGTPFEVRDRERALIYFDDHVDQWRRIREAAERQFRYLIFDDNLPSTALHNDGSAAVPTIDMLFDDELRNGDEIRWRTEGGDFTYRHDATQAERTRGLVEAHLRLPDLRFVFGYNPANLTLVVLR